MSLLLFKNRKKNIIARQSYIFKFFLLKVDILRILETKLSRYIYHHYNWITKIKFIIPWHSFAVRPAYCKMVHLFLHKKITFLICMNTHLINKNDSSLVYWHISNWHLHCTEGNVTSFEQYHLYFQRYKCIVDERTFCLHNKDIDEMWQVGAV